MTLFLIAAALAAPDVQIRIAPDQPVPFVYVDEPLVVEVASPGAVEAAVQVEIEGENGQTAAVDLGRITLGEDGTHWLPLEDVAFQRGRYRARFTVTAGEETLQQERTFCRIDRPVPGYSFPLCANVEGETAEHLSLAVAAIPGRAVRLSAGPPDLEARAEEARANGLPVVVAFPLDRLEDAPALAERLAQKLGDRVLRWEVEAGSRPEQVEPLAAALRRSQSRAPLGLVVADKDALRALLEAGAGEHANAIVLARDAAAPEELLELRRTAETFGYEGMSLAVLGRAVRSNVMQPGERLGRRIVLHMVAGAESAVDADRILDAKGFSADYVRLCGLAHRLQGAAYVGSLELEKGVHAPVFRQGDGWVVAIWSDGGPQDVELRTGSVENLLLSDSRNNPIPFPGKTGEKVSLTATADLLYLSGKGGTLLVDAARRSAHEEVRHLLSRDDIEERLPAELGTALKAIEARGPGVVDRRAFLMLLGALPTLEELHQAGTLPTEVAVPASAALGRLLRHLCIVEQARGEPFLEPLREMLAKCTDYTSRYLTGSGANGGGYRRQDWLLAEVGRLMAEAQQLADNGRGTEADAVAALAEARARALQFAAPRQAVTRLSRPHAAAPALD